MTARINTIVHIKRGFAVICCAAAMLLALSAGRATADNPQYGGTLKIATLGLDTADPHRHTGSIAVQQVYAETLTSIANDGSVKPFLAERYEITPDGLTYTFTLRDDLKFHNGRVMNAQDVAANFKRVKDNVSKGWLASAMKQVEAFEAKGDKTFVVHMQKPYAAFLNLISELWILAPESEGWDSTITHPIGTGPFKFGEWIPNVTFNAPKHEEYWQKGLPYLDALQFDLRDSKDNDLALRSGDLHVASVSMAKIPSLIKDPKIEILNLKDTTWYFWSFNNRNPSKPFDNVRVREAVTYAMDKAAFMDFVAGDKGIVTNQMVIPGNFYFDEAVHNDDRHANPDLVKARKILAEEGVNPGEVTIKLVSWQQPYAEVSVQMIKKLGFKVNHLSLDDLGAQNELGKYEWDVASMASGPRADVFLRYVRMMSDGPNPVLWGGVQDPEYDAIVTRAITTVDPEKRRDAYLDAWQRVLDNYYTVVIGHAANAIAVREEVQGFDTGFTWSQNRVDGGVAFTWLKK
jgi:peptide/nickel transport system substrate-binding protein